MKTALSLSVIITLCILSFLGYYSILLIRHIDREIPKIDKALVSVQNIESATVATEGQVAGAVDDLDTIVENEQKQQTQQLTDLHNLSVHADSVLTDLDTAVKSGSQIAPAIQQAVVDADRDIHNTLVASQSTMQAATSDLNDPDIHKAVGDLAESSAQLKIATTEGAATMTTVHKGVDYEVAELMKPVRKAKAALLFVATVAGKFLGY